MRLVLCLPDGGERILDASPGLSAMEVLRREGLIEGECNGSLACATCHVWVDAAWLDRLPAPSAGEEDMLDVAFNISAQSRLSCQIMMTDEMDGLRLRLPRSLPDG
jgi:2Fe-2S ferredoxin